MLQPDNTELRVNVHFCCKITMKKYQIGIININKMGTLLTGKTISYCTLPCQIYYYSVLTYKAYELEGITIHGFKLSRANASGAR